MADAVGRVVVTPEGSVTGAAIRARLRAQGWAVEAAASRDPDALVFDPGLLDDPPVVPPNRVVDEFLAESQRHHMSRIVVVSTRDQLGWSTRPELAAAGGALVSAARSLALRLAPKGTTVNVVAAFPPRSSALRDERTSDASAEPSELTPEPVTAEDVANVVAFFLHPRSHYITGQVLYCCGGTSLLSSLSV
ncbi:enoyl-ACP reductase-like protein [Prauserella shujinwangii]|uniref:Enoyl-ACP reductase-like protein n=1 Tax=Prauserella shujinwangii TaxID=1453103 RepID=A0A2T0M0R0_9PSEU|nr:SDR family oxidoreductase [Prauserella shujinwangii]PRX50130.1 enoyl-ACP reductase-like protein [Prauserella shujinwangii]